MISIQVNVCVLCQKLPVLTNKYTKLINYIRGEIAFAKYIKSLFLLYFYKQNFYLFDLDLNALLANFQNFSGDDLPLYTSSEWGKHPGKWMNKAPFSAWIQSAAEGHFGCYQKLTENQLAITAHVWLLSCSGSIAMRVIKPRNLPF